MDKEGCLMVCRVWKTFKRVKELLYLNQPPANCQKCQHLGQFFVEVHEDSVSHWSEKTMPRSLANWLASRPNPDYRTPLPHFFSAKLQAGVCPSSLSPCYPGVPLPHPAISWNIHSESTDVLLVEVIFQKEPCHYIISMFKWACSSRCDQHHLPVADSIFMLTQSHRRGEANKVKLDRQPDWDKVHFCPQCLRWNTDHTLHFSNIFPSK